MLLDISGAGFGGSFVEGCGFDVCSVGGVVVVLTSMEPFGCSDDLGEPPFKAVKVDMVKRRVETRRWRTPDKTSVSR